MQCAVGQFALLRRDGQDFPSFIRRYSGERHDRVEVVVINRREVAQVELGSLVPLHHSEIDHGLVGFEATHGEYGEGIIDGEVAIAGILFVIIMRIEDNTDSGLVPIDEIALGPPKWRC